jgi:HK97 family phage major capsid protein
VLVPTQLREHRTGLDSATSGSGAEFKYTEFGGELIELLRNATQVIRMGARMLPGLNGPVGFPRQTGGATVSWVEENPASGVSANTPTFDTVTLTPKTMQGHIPFSRQLLQQSVLAVEPIVRQDLAEGHARAFDKAAIHGLGSANQPAGIYRTTGVTAKAMGGVPTYAKLQSMITAVAVANALMRSLGWLTTPEMAGLMASTLAFSAAGAKTIWEGAYDDGKMNGYRAVATNQVSALMSTLVDTGGSQHGIIFGNWNDLMIGTWGALELLTDPYTLADKGMVKVTSFQMGDIEIRHPASFCVATGATLS